MRGMLSPPPPYRSFIRVSRDGILSTEGPFLRQLRRVWPVSGVALAEDFSLPVRSVILTSPPYWTLKEYPLREGQLGLIAGYDTFHDELEKVWRHCFRVLIPGGRLVCVVGDVCLSRRRHGRHMVMPMHADIVVRARRIGFDNLSPIFWYKIANANYEVENGSSFLGKPYEPNAIIKNDAEFILMLRKPGGYRQPTMQQRNMSRLSKEEYQEWFQQIWTLQGESTREHPAPYPEK